MPERNETTYKIKGVGTCIWDGSTLRLSGSEWLKGPRLAWTHGGRLSLSESLSAEHKGAILGRAWEFPGLRAASMAAMARIERELDDPESFASLEAD